MVSFNHESDKVEQPEQELGTAALEESFQTEPEKYLWPETSGERQVPDQDKNRIEEIQRELGIGERPPENIDDDGGDDDRGGDRAGDFQQVNNTYITQVEMRNDPKYVACPACKGTGKKWLMFNCGTCKGSGLVRVLVK